MYCVQDETFSIYGGYVSEKSHDRKTTMIDVKTSWEKWGYGNHITRNTEHKKEESFVLMFLGMILVFLAKRHGDQMKCSAWWR
jgi:hypothetical protein